MMAGRPTDYSSETADALCERIASGRSLRSICQDAEMPAERTVYSWLAAHEEFAQKYTRAREQQADLYADEIIEIADNEPDANKARVRIDARKWKSARMAPKKYGDKLEHEHSGSIDSNVTHNGEITLSGTTAFVAEALGGRAAGASEEPGQD